jgi:hypothetical protein
MTAFDAIREYVNGLEMTGTHERLPSREKRKTWATEFQDAKGQGARKIAWYSLLTLREKCQKE